ncbi:MAG: choice-of-anchor R domain-containing protein [Terriglobales bacterium]
MRNSATVILSLFALTAVLAIPSLADSTAFTDLGAGGSYDTMDGFAICGLSSGCGHYQSTADGFTAEVGGVLSQINVALGYVLGTNSAVVSVYTDVSGGLGSLLFSGTVAGTTSTGLATLTPSSGSLVAGHDYFLVITPGAADTFDGWAYNNQNAVGPVLIDNGLGFSNEGSETLEAFDVKVNAATVPEPSSWLMLGAELLLLLGVSAAHRKLFA